VKGLGLFFLCSCALLLLPIQAAVTNSAARNGANATNTWLEIKTADMDERALKNCSAARELLESDPDKWRHGQTPHYVIHFFANEGDLFARKVAELVEFLYGYISQDLGLSQDRHPLRSHIFTFRNEYRWKKFLKTQSSMEKWSYSYVFGACMFLQQAKNTKDSSEVIAHENTHLVVNHFVPGRLPIWLNEGVAEYYGEFGLSEFRGLKRHPGSVFRGLSDALPLTRLLKITKDYPSDEKEVHKFYATSKYFVGFLLTKKPHDKFPAFLMDIAKDVSVIDALREHYGFSDVTTLQKEFSRFCH
jgi:hypothetical protein